MRKVQSLFLMASLALLAACSSPAARNTAPMTQAEARVAADAALGGLAMSGALVGDPYSLTGQQVGAMGIPVQAASALEAAGMNLPQAVSAGCKIDIGSWTDADADFIPAGFTLTVSACTYADGGSGFSYSFEGGLKLEDTNDAQKNSGFKLTFQNFKERASKGAESLERSLDGSYLLDTRTNTLFKADKGYTAGQTYTSGAQTDTISVRYGVSETYAPKNPQAPKAGGTFTIAQSSPGSLNITRNANAYSWSWYTDPGLEYDRACRARTPKGDRIPFVGGSAVYTYTNPGGQVSTLKIAFSGCGQYTVTLDGQSL